MSEADLIKRTDTPLTAKTLADELRRCGVQAGQTIIVHLAMSKLNWVIGGAQAVIQGLLSAVGDDGTIIMPTHTLYNIDPKEWQHPPLPEDWHQLIRDNVPAYDPVTSPTYFMGAVPELFRTYPNAIRSAHPATSFAAIGANAHTLMNNHPLEDETGRHSPLGKLYDLDGHVLLLGVDHWNNTSLHLAEDMADYPGKSWHQVGSAMMVDGKREWVEYEVYKTYGDDFGAIGEAFDTAHNITIDRIASADVRFFEQRLVVDFAVQWIETNRDLTDTSK